MSRQCVGFRPDFTSAQGLNNGLAACECLTSPESVLSLYKDGPKAHGDFSMKQRSLPAGRLRQYVSKFGR